MSRLLVVILESEKLIAITKPSLPSNMNKNHLLVFLFLFVLSLFSSIAFAQEEKAAKASGISLFFEKVYLHTDKDYYASGNDIWFKAYLLNGQSNYLTNTSNNLYVELISPKAELLERKVIRLEGGAGAGDFALGDSIPSGTYRLRAYTSWMRNFGENFLFEKELKVVSLLDLPSADPVSSPSANKIEFFPEGGALLEGVAGRVAFKAESSEGKGIAVEGVVISSGGDTVSMFQSSHLGMGLITFFPVPGEQYQVKGRFNGKEAFAVPFPASLKKGFAIQLMDAGPQDLMLIVRTDPATLEEYQDKIITIAGRSAGKVYFSGDVQLNGAQTTLKLPKDYFPAGIANITLYDAEKRPQCERLVYIDRQEKDKVSLNVKASKQVFGTREKVVMRVTVRDAQNGPVKTNLSLSVLNADLVPEGINDIRSYLMLESEVRGAIEHPGQYFDPQNEERAQQLVLLLMTQGWRGFVWRKLQEDGISIKYLPEPGISISGRVRKLQSNKPLEGVNISLYAPGAKGSALFSTQSNVEGNYFLDGLEFYGKQAITLTARDKKGKKEGWISMNPLFSDTMALQPKNPFSPGIPVSGLDPFKKEEDQRAKANRAFRLASDDFLLNEVEIKADRERERVQKIKHTTAIAVNVTQDVSELGVETYDLKIGEEEAGMVNVANFLENRFPGSERVEGDLYLRVRGAMVMPKFYMDGSTMEEPGNPYPVHISTMSMREIERIIVTGSHVSIFRRENPLPPKEFSRIDQMVEGYYEVREFYKPQYSSANEAPSKPDYRTTIHWEPTIVTDASGEAEITFYNTDRKGKVRAVIEGVSEKGVPLVNVSGYEVR